MSSAHSLFPPEHRSEASQVLVNVLFEAGNGDRRSAIGGGDSLGDAIAFARESIPRAGYWRVIRVNELYGI